MKSRLVLAVLGLLVPALGCAGGGDHCSSCLPQFDGGTAGTGRGGSAATGGSTGTAGVGGTMGGTIGSTGGAAGTSVAGSNGTAGAAGSSTGGVSGANGGAGTGGSAGTGGMAGSSSAGGGGTGGGGTAGSGGAGTGGTAGSGGATAGTGGGSAGNGGTGGVPLPAVLALYSFEQTAGPMITDTSGNSHNATLMGTGTFPTGQVGTDLSFNGTTTYVVVPPLLTGATEMTIATWVRVRTDRNWDRVFDFGTSKTAYMYLVPHTLDTNKLRFSITTAGNGMEQRIDGTAFLPVGTWTHVAVVLPAGGGGTLYVDGAVAGTTPTMTLRPKDLGAMTSNWLGHSEFSGDPYFDGELDEFRIYDKALTAAQITDLYTAR